MKSSLRLAACLLTILVVPGCGGEPAKAGTSGKRDRGSASMQFGNEAWEADSAKAWTRDTILGIELVRSQRAGTVTTREQLKLTISDFDGPGTYSMSGGSTFLTVPVDVSHLARDVEAQGVQAKAPKSAVAQPEMLSLSDGEIVVTSFTSKEVEGTFQWTPPKNGAAAGRAIKAGSFRALVR